jgi:hypothetical protein
MLSSCVAIALRRGQLIEVALAKVAHRRARRYSAHTHTGKTLLNESRSLGCLRAPPLARSSRQTHPILKLDFPEHGLM